MRSISKDNIPRINEEITAPQVRLVGSKGDQVGVVSLEEALAHAEKEDLDLVEVAPQGKPPVAKVMDFGKFRYDQQKRLKESRKKQHVIAVKEVRMRPSIGDHDLETKITSAKKFLEDGSRLKVSLRFRGREMARPELGRQLMDRIIEMLADYAVVEKNPVIEGRMMTMHLVPKH